MKKLFYKRNVTIIISKNDKDEIILQNVRASRYKYIVTNDGTIYCFDIKKECYCKKDVPQWVFWWVIKNYQR